MSAQIATRIARLIVLLLVLTSACASAAASTDIVLMLDNSGSMQKNDPKHLTKVAVRTFLQTLGGDTDVAVVIFDQGVRLAMPLTPLNEQSRPEFLRSLDAINFKGLLTDSPAALERSIYELKVNGRAGAEKSIVFMTDGIVDTGDKARDADKIRWMREELAPAAAEAGIRIFGIAFTENADFELIQSLARRTRGAYYRAFAARDVDGVFNNIITLFDQSGAPAVVTQPDQPAEPQPALSETTAAAVATVTEPAATALPELATPPSNETSLPDSPPPETTRPTTGEPLPEDGLPALPLATEAPSAGVLPDAEMPSTGTLPDAEVTNQTPPVIGDETTAEQAPATTPASAPGAPSPQAASPNATSAGTETGALGGVGDTLLMAAALLLIVVAIGLGAVVVRRKRAARKPAEPIGPKAFLNDLRGVTAQPSYELTDKVTVIGRIKGADAESCDYIVIDEPTVGRRHSIIEFKEHAYWVTDQSSINGTYVNNKRIEGGVRLKHGDRVRFHKHEFEFLMLDMFETDRTMVSATMYAAVPSAGDSLSEDDDRTKRRVRAAATADPASADPTEP